jgi:hypothetical protein
MNKEFIPYEQALELKELGFNEKCIMYYGDSLNGYTLQSTDYWYSNSHRMFNANDNKDRHLMCAAPLYQQAFRWFREKYFLGHGINPYSLDAHLIDLEDCIFYDIDDVYTYEEAELACLKKLIEIVKNKQN